MDMWFGTIVFKKCSVCGEHIYGWQRRVLFSTSGRAGSKLADKAWYAHRKCFGRFDNRCSFDTPDVMMRSLIWSRLVEMKGVIPEGLLLELVNMVNDTDVDIHMGSYELSGERMVRRMYYVTAGVLGWGLGMLVALLTL